MAASVPVEINNLQTQTKSVFFYSVHVASIVSSVYDGMYAPGKSHPRPSILLPVCLTFLHLDLETSAMRCGRSWHLKLFNTLALRKRSSSQSVCLYWLVLAFPRQHIHKGFLLWFSPQQSTLTTMFSPTIDDAVCVFSQMQISLPAYVTAGLQFRTSAWVITERRNLWWSREIKACSCTCIGWNASILFICFVDMINYRLLPSPVILLFANVQRIKNIQTSFNKTRQKLCANFRHSQSILSCLAKKRVPNTKTTKRGTDDFYLHYFLEVVKPTSVQKIPKYNPSIHLLFADLFCIH